MVKDSIKVNSQTISKNFPERYRELFSECEIVVSSNDSFFWTGEYVRFYGGVTAQQKLPTKVYIGLEVTPEEDVCFAEKLYGYAPYQNSFNVIQFEPAKEHRLMTFLSEYIKTQFVKGRKFGFKIHILSEAHCGGGLGSTGVIMACLATSLLLLYNKIKPSDVLDIKNLPLQDQIQDPKSKFNQIFRLAWRLTAVARGGESSGSTSFAAMLHTFHPVVFVPENVDKIKDHPSVTSYKNQLENCQIFDQLSYWGGSLGDIFGLKESVAWPIDVARIWSGSVINTENILKSILKIKNELREQHEFVTRTLARKLDFEKTKDKPYFYGPISRDTQGEVAWQDNIDILNYGALRVVLGLGKIFKEGSSDDSLRDFFFRICNAHNLSQYLGSSTPVLDHMYQTLIEQALRVNESIGGGAKLESIGKGGHIVFVFPPGILWEKMDKIISDLQVDTKKDIFLDWASWRDGFGKDGLILEQYMDAKIFSSFIPPDSCRISFWEAGKLVTQKITSVQEKDKLANDQKSIFLDSIEGKIYFCGKKVTSKEIPSTTATIQTIAACLKNENSTIKNSDLPSAYSQNRYDLQSKIAIPFAKACEKYSGHRCNFQIHGDMYDNYSLCLEPNSLRIILAEPISFRKKYL